MCSEALTAPSQRGHWAGSEQSGQVSATGTPRGIRGCSVTYRATAARQPGQSDLPVLTAPALGTIETPSPIRWPTMRTHAIGEPYHGGWRSCAARCSRSSLRIWFRTRSQSGQPHFALASAKASWERITAPGQWTLHSGHPKKPLPVHRSVSSPQSGHSPPVQSEQVTVCAFDRRAAIPLHRAHSGLPARAPDGDPVLILKADLLPASRPGRTTSVTSGRSEVRCPESYVPRTRWLRSRAPATLCGTPPESLRCGSA